MKMLIIRGGFIRDHVVTRLREGGHEVTLLRRDQEHACVRYAPRLPYDVAIHMYAMTGPAQVRRLAPQIPLSPSFRTVEEILQLPVQSVVAGIGQGRPAWPGFSKVSKANTMHLYWQDTWRGHPRLTVNYGLGWSYEPQALNSGLGKPAYLIPIPGVDGVRPPRTDPNNFAPSGGFAWTATKDSKTVIRAGAGIYYDRSNIPGTALLAGGRSIDFSSAPTPFTGSQFLQLLPGIRASTAALVRTGLKTDSACDANPDAGKLPVAWLQNVRRLFVCYLAARPIPRCCLILLRNL
jgi:TonB dependent receptor